MDFITELRKVDERLAAAEPCAVDVDSSMVEEPTEVIAALQETYHSLKRFESLNNTQTLTEGRKIMKSITEKVENLNDHVATWLSYHDNDGYLDGPGDVNNMNTAQLSRIRLDSLELTTNFGIKMAVAAEISEISNVLVAIDAAVDECCTELAAVNKTADLPQPRGELVEIPESASPQAPIYCDADIVLNQKLSRLRALAKALQQSVQFIPTRMETLQTRAQKYLPQGFDSLTAQLEQLNTRIQKFNRDFESTDSRLTHDSWLPIIADSGNPRIKNYAKIRGFCDRSPEKAADVAIALFRGLKPPRKRIGPFLPVLLPPSPPSLSSGSEDHSASASFETSEEETDFFSTSPLKGKGVTNGSTLYIPRIRKERFGKLMQPTLIIKGQFARGVPQNVPVPIPKPTSRLQPPTPCSLSIAPLTRRFSSLDLQFQQVYSGIPTPRCSSLCTK